MTAVAIIPARSGSKRIKNKNIKSFSGRPILEWVIRTALSSKLFDKVIVSTDCEKIAGLSEAVGAEIPYLRPENLSNDYAGVQEVVIHAIDFLDKKDFYFDTVTLLYATAPFVTKEYLSKSLEAIKHVDFSISVCAFPHPVERALRLSEKGNVIEMIDKEHYLIRSQDHRILYHDAGQFVSGRKHAWKTKVPLLSGNTAPIIVPRFQAQDIDNEEDWLEAELKFLVLKKKGLIVD